MFQYCPSCASKKIKSQKNRFHCPDCEFVYFQNTAAATGCVIDTGDTVALLVRGNEPAKGKLDLPGGFVDPGEGILISLLRELREELGWEPPIPPGKPLETYFTLFASFPNTYVYRDVPYNTCDIFFFLLAPEFKQAELKLEEGEVAEIRFVRPEDINLDDLAFDSTRRAMEAFISYKIPKKTESGK